MQECEILCDRLTILVKGNMKCIGTTRHLKNKFAKGYSLKIKLREPLKDGDKEDEETTEFVKETLVAKFKSDTCSLIDEQRVSSVLLHTEALLIVSLL